MTDVEQRNDPEPGRYIIFGLMVVLALLISFKAIGGIAAPSVSRRSPVSGLVACSPTHSSEVVSYKRDSLAFTKVNRSMAIHSNPGIYCNKERQMSARKNPRADLSDPYRPYTRRPG